MTANIRPDLVRAQARIDASGALLANVGCASAVRISAGVYQIEIPQLPPNAVFDVTPIAASPLVASVIAIGPTTLEVRLASSGAQGTSEERRDFSVNGARVEGFAGAVPILRTSTQRNVAAGYVGGGLGNKAILGHATKGAGFPLAELLALAWTSFDLSPENSPLVSGNDWPYMNLVVELDPQIVPAAYSIFSIAPTQFLTLNLGTETILGKERAIAWDVLLNNSQVVLDRGMYETPPFIAPPGPWPAGLPGFGYIPANLGPGSGNPPVGSWTSRSYKLADILGVWPTARIVNAYPADGGLPNATTVTGFLLAIGDSANLVLAIRRLDVWTVTQLGFPVQSLLETPGGSGAPTDAEFALTVTVA